jgi:hypothetical protein
VTRLAGVLGAVVALVAWMPAPGLAQDAAERAFDLGIRLYEEGDFAGAAEAFDQVLESGVEDATVHYNLGNASFKAGRLGAAVYHYRRAHALAPRDADIAANLEYARFLALDRIEGARTDRPVDGWLDRITPDEAAMLPMALWILAGAAGCAWQLFRPGRGPFRSATLALAAAWVVTLAGAGWVSHRASRQDEGVVLAREATVRNGPGTSFETAFVLHEGAEVVVEGERGEWIEVSLPGDLRGWIDEGSIARL